jgi:hypothetical protein
VGCFKRGGEQKNWRALVGIGDIIEALVGIGDITLTWGG